MGRQSIPGVWRYKCVLFYSHKLTLSLPPHSRSGHIFLLLQDLLLLPLRLLSLPLPSSSFFFSSLLSSLCSSLCTLLGYMYYSLVAYHKNLSNLAFFYVVLRELSRFGCFFILHILHIYLSIIALYLIYLSIYLYVYLLHVNQDHTDSRVQTRWSALKNKALAKHIKKYTSNRSQAANFMKSNYCIKTTFLLSCSVFHFIFIFLFLVLLVTVVKSVMMYDMKVYYVEYEVTLSNVFPFLFFAGEYDEVLLTARLE